MDWLLRPEAWTALLALTAMEIVLGIDNLVFVSLIAGTLPPHQRQRGRLIGMSLAMVTRIALLVSIAWIARLTTPLTTVLGHEVSWRDIIMLGGGVFLLAKSTHELHHAVEGHDEQGPNRLAGSFVGVIAQIVALDIVFSLDSVITAVGMASDVPVMVAAVVIAVLVMLFASAGVGAFLLRHPTVKMLALSFLLLIGVSLVAEGLGQHIPKGYIYFAMAFSLLVEALNLRAGRGSHAAGEPAALEPAAKLDTHG